MWRSMCLAAKRPHSVCRSPQLHCHMTQGLSSVISRGDGIGNLSRMSPRALPAGVDTSSMVVQEFAYGPGGWVLARDNVSLAEHKKVFAPANLR